MNIKETRNLLRCAAVQDMRLILEATAPGEYLVAPAGKHTFEAIDRIAAWQAIDEIFATGEPLVIRLERHGEATWALLKPENSLACCPWFAIVLPESEE